MQFFLSGTEFFHTGGIQRVNRLLLDAFEELAQQLPATFHLFSYADDPGTLPANLARTPSLRWHAFSRRRGAMAAAIAREALRVQPHGALFTHVSLLPLLRILHAVSPRTRTGLLGHGVEVWKPLSRALRAALSRADSVVAPSRFTAAQLMAHNGVAPERVRVIPHSLPPDWTTPPRITGARNQSPQILTVARLTPADVYKGVGRVLAAMPTVVQRHPGAHLTIAGDGADRARLEAISVSQGTSRHVAFLGNVSDVDLRDLYARADLFVLPSQKEGFGLVFLEAMFYGVPVIAAQAGGAVDVVEDGVTGALLGGDRAATVAAAINALLGDPARRARMARAAQERVMKHFLFSHFSKNWTNWLASLCPGPFYTALQSAFEESARPAQPSAA